MKKSFAIALGLAIYLIVDIVYVVSSQNFYGPVMNQLNGGASVSAPLIYAAGAYGCMAVGWIFFAVLRFETFFSQGWGLARSAFWAGLLYGLTVYGVFNFTLGLMAKAWHFEVLARDLLWGISWSIGSLGVYGWLKNRI